MPMKIALIGVTLVIALVVLALVLRPKRGGPVAGYRRRDFLSKAERFFFGVLQQAVGRDGLVFAKVRLADLLAPAGGSGSGGWQSALNRIKAKHLDFVVCSLGDVVPRLAIELDDTSQRPARRKERDQFLESVCQSAGLPLLRIPAHRDYAVQQLRQQLAAYLDITPERPTTLEVPALPEPPAVAPPAPDPAAAAVPPTAPLCPKCGAPMMQCEGKSGVLAGKAFWGCTNSPQCKGLLPFVPGH